MASRPTFIPINDKENLVEIKQVKFTWFPGFARSQKLKSIKSFHEAISKSLNKNKILEISTKSEIEEGRSGSAFNLKLLLKEKSYTLESLFQGSKVFKRGGPYTDLYNIKSIDAKKDERIKNSGQLVGFSFFDEKFNLNFDFYSWLYFIGLKQNIKLLKKLINYEAFTDIEFNPEKSYNCQAYSAALFVSYVNNQIFNLNKEYSIEELKSMMPQKKINNFQLELI
jgi:hypothetical protein